jgi:hypothetical protein
LRRDLRSLPVQAFSAKYLELTLPAGGQGGVEAAGPGVGEQRIVGTLHVPVRVAFLLVRPTVFWRDRLEFRDVLERRLEVTRIAATHGSHVEGVRIVGLGAEYLGKIRQRVVETLRHNLLLDRPKIRKRAVCFHELSHHQ